jgi:lipoprotein-anchoring transpeptidase ErfK/SrfK
MGILRSFTKHLFLPVAALTLAAAGAQAAAAQTTSVLPQALVPPRAQRLLVVSIPDRRIALVENGVTLRVYPVAVGKASTPSPTGRFTIVRRVVDPTYSHKGRVVAPGPKNPVGSRWMGLSEAGYGIHGTNEPDSIGKAASHGCIRMAKGDLEQLYALVEVGDAVEIHSQHDATVAFALGGPAPTLPPAAAPVVLPAAVQLAGNRLPAHQGGE